MEFIVIHKPISIMPPDMITASIELTRKTLAKPEEVVPGGKLIASYQDRCKPFVVCIWDALDVESLMPFIEQMSMLGWDNEVILAEKLEVGVERIAKALEAKMAKK